MSVPANTQDTNRTCSAKDLPSWVPTGARLYLSHVAQGRSLRELGRVHGCHASTVLRHIRQFETRRDDPLVDDALRRLDLSLRSRQTSPPQKEPRPMMISPNPALTTDKPDHLADQAMAALRHLVRPKAHLIVAADMPKSVITCERRDGVAERLAVLERDVAEAMALNGWIRLRKQGRVSSYAVSAAGRQALRKHCAANGLDYEPFGAPDVPLPSKRLRYTQPETPVTVLARRQDLKGRPFLEPAQVQAAARLREEFVMAQLEDTDITCATEMLAALERGALSAPACPRTRAARAALAEMLRDLGPGLGDMVLRCCCRLEGVEATERDMGWSARSGKIVLRIALQRAASHYAQLAKGGGLIG